MYLEYSDYADYGGKLNQAAFNRFCFRAEKLIDIYTFSRLKGVSYSDIPEEVKRCMYELIEYIKANMLDGDTRAVQSEGNDGYSVSYESKTSEQAIYDIIYTYLCDTDLLYRGTDL